MIRRQRLPHRHAIYQLAADLWLVFKPRGHLEVRHAHDYKQRMHLVRGQLEVRFARQRVVLGGSRRSLSMARDIAHSTRAIEDTWLIVERVPGRSPEKEIHRD